MTNETFEAYKRPEELITDARLIPAWTADGTTLGFVSGPANNKKAWRVDLNSGEKSPLCDLDKLRGALLATGKVNPPAVGCPFDQFGFIDADTITFAIGPQGFTYSIAHETATALPKPNLVEKMMGLTEEARRTPKPFKRSMPLVDPTDAYEIGSPDGQWMLSIQNHNVAIRSTYDGREVLLTEGGTSELEWNVDWQNPALAMLGMDQPVTNWAPNSEKVAVYRVDNRGVAQRPQLHCLKRYDECVFRYHAVAGGTLERYSLYVLDVAGRAPIEIQLGDTTDTYPIFAGWIHDSSELLIFRMTRNCCHIDILAANPDTGAVRLLFSEQAETFLRIHHDTYFGRKLGLNLTPDGQYILWLSERDGYRHIYQYSREGELVAQLTRGDWPVMNIKRIDRETVYFEAHRDPSRPYDVHLCSVPLGGGDVKQLTHAPGKHQVVFSPDGNVFLDTWSTPDKPPVTALVSKEGKMLNDNLLEADISQLEAVGYTPAEQFTVTAADGETELWGVMYKPHDFDPGKKYPLIEYIYGGPQIAVTEHGFPIGAFSTVAAMLAQAGCITIMLDARGTPERSKAFHDTVVGNWYGTLVADHTAAVKQIAERYDFIDGDRVGVTGGSWGGDASTRLVLESPDVYKCAVSLAPGYCPHSSVLYECYLGMPQDYPEAYARADLPSQAHRFAGELQIQVGNADHATFSDAVKMSEALIRAGKQHELVLMPDQYHGFDTVHSNYGYDKMLAFFDRHLKLVK